MIEPCPSPVALPAAAWGPDTDRLLEDCHARAVRLHRRIERRAARHTLVAHATACCGFVGGMLGSFLVVGAQGAVPPGVVCALSTLAAGAALSHAQDKVTFLTSWYAQAEHGGYYQAIATGRLFDGPAWRARARRASAPEQESTGDEA